MSDSQASNPLTLKIVSCDLYKYDRSDKINLMPQMAEIVIFESIFDPILKVELTVYDPIGLFYNYPLIGEESIEISYYPTFDSSTTERPLRWLRLHVASAELIQPAHTVRGQLYKLTLYSQTFRQNAKSTLRIPYYDRYDNMVKKVLIEQLYVDAKDKIDDFYIEKSLGQYHIVIPGYHPLEACQWFAKRAVSENYSTNWLYFFFETLSGYQFRTFEHMQQQIDLYSDKRDIQKTPEYFYISNSSEPILQNFFNQNPNTSEHNIILAYQLNKRWNTSEKIVCGYYENEYFDIDIMNRQIHSKKTILTETPNKPVANSNVFKMNTPLFVDSMITQDKTPGASTRVRFIISQNQGDEQTEDNQWRFKWGESVRSLSGLSQISLTASFEGDSRILVGDCLKITVPEIHGFTTLKEDKFLTGYYVITELKHIISVGSKHITVATMNRNNYSDNVQMQMKYGNVGENNG